MKISLFKNASSVRPAQVDIEKIFGVIKSDTYKELTEAIRALPSNSEEQKELKKSLPAVTFGGTFTKRAINGLAESSGLLVLDFDGEGVMMPTDLEKFAYAQFRSPRGGLKVVIKIPLVKDDKQFKEYFYALQEKFPDIDLSGKDISRLCFLSHDPTLTVNESSLVWMARKERPKAEPITEDHRLQRKTITSNFSKMTIAMGMIRSAPQGSRSEECLRAGRLIGGYIAGGEIMETEVEFFKAFIETNAPDDYKDHTRSFLRGVEAGKTMPLKDRDKERKAIKATFKATEHFPIDISFDLDDDVEASVWNTWRTGRKRGEATGWDCLDQHYSIILGSTTYVYGAPTAGKSYFVLNLLVNLSRIHNWNHIVFSPESGYHTDIFNILIEIYTGKDITSEHGNQISESEMRGAIKFVKEHFTVIDPEVSGADEDLSVLTMMNYVEYLCTKKQYHTVTIDPIIELKTIEDNEREDLFLKNALNLFRRTCKVLNLHGFIAVHVRNLGSPAGIDDEGNPYWRPASFYELAGGQMWSRKGFMIIGLWRHKFFHGEEMELKKINRTVRRNHTLVSIVKVKPKGAGNEGECWLKFDPTRNQFIDPTSVPYMAPMYPARDFTESKAQAQSEIEYTNPYDNAEPSWIND